MLVKVVCHDCGSIKYLYEKDRKGVKEVIKIYKNGKFTCGKCLGNNRFPIIGYLEGLNSRWIREENRIYKRLAKINNIVEGDETRIDLTTFIRDLDSTERYNLCEECHSKFGCGNLHDKYLWDTGNCYLCGKKADVVNCAIANEVVNRGISPLIYWERGNQRIYLRNTFL